MTVLIDLKVTALTRGNNLAIIPITDKGFGEPSYLYKRENSLPIQLPLYKGSSFLLVLGYQGDNCDQGPTPNSYENPIAELEARELELLAVIEQMREALSDYICHHTFDGKYLDAAQKALALTPESALKEHDARVLEGAADKCKLFHDVAFGRWMEAELRRMAEERRKP